MRLRPFWFLTSVVFFATMLSTLSTEQEVQDCSDNPTPQPSIKPSTTPTKSPSSCDTVTHVPSKPGDGSKPHKMPSKPSKPDNDHDGGDGGKPHKMPSKPPKTDNDHDGGDGGKPHKMPSKPPKTDNDHDGGDGDKPHKMPSSGRTYSPSLIYCDTPEPTCQITPSPTVEPLRSMNQMQFTSGITSVYDDVTPVKKAPKHLGAAVSTAQMSQWSTLFPPSPPSPLV